MSAPTGERDVSDAGSEPPLGVTTARYRPDRFTMAIALGAVLLVGALLALVLARPQRTAPMNEGRPAGVVHNYFLALMNDDPKTAYGYLTAEAQSKLSYESFAATRRVGGRTGRVRIEDERVEGDTARVTVRTSTTLSGPFPFSSGDYSFESTAVLRLEGGSWKLTQAL